LPDSSALAQRPTDEPVSPSEPVRPLPPIVEPELPAESRLSDTGSLSAQGMAEAEGARPDEATEASTSVVAQRTLPVPVLETGPSQAAVDTEAEEPSSLAVKEPALIASLDLAQLSALPPSYRPSASSAGELRRSSLDSALYAMRGDMAGSEPRDSAASMASEPFVSLLAPRTLGRTSDARATLYYYVPPRAADLSFPVELTLVATNRAAPLLAITLENPLKPGIHSISLAERAERLTVLPAGHRYIWSGSLVLDPDRPEKNPTTQAFIQFVEPSEALTHELEVAPPEHAANIYSEHSLWYDALHALSEFIAQHPHSRELRNRRANLLETEDLKGAASFERTSH